jgi:subtilisin family serine protease
MRWVAVIAAAIGLPLIVPRARSTPPLPDASGAVVPNDPLFREQISYYFGGGTTTVRLNSTRLERRTLNVASGVSLDLPRAWSVTTGSRSVIVAILDDGFAYHHEDISPNVWRNPGETGRDANGIPREANGLDDDRNGYVDDVVGYDFAFDDPDPDPYVFDGMDRSRVQPYWHSISALGIIGAVGNNGRGVSGIAWRTSLMLLKIGAQGTPRGERDTLRSVRAARAIRYAADNAARIINWSGFVDDTSRIRLEALREAIRYAGRKGVLFVVGAGNDARDLDDEANCLYPQCFDEPNVIRVAELDFDGTLARYRVGDGWRGSNFGNRRVEIAAVGQNFTTMIRNGESTYALAGGTSNSGPVVAGVAALMLAANTALTAVDLRHLLMTTATRLPSLTGKVVSGGTVNAYRAVLAARERRSSSTKLHGP